MQELKKTQIKDEEGGFSMTPHKIECKHEGHKMAEYTTTLPCSKNLQSLTSFLLEVKVLPAEVESN